MSERSEGRRSLDLVALADFTLVARYGGFGKAARATRRPKATLSRRVAELEASLSIRLFERGGRNLTLTEEGRALQARAGALLEELDDTVAALASGATHPQGVLRISAPLLFSQTAMGKIAAQFCRKFPDVRLVVTSDDRQVDMIEEGYDLVIRVDPDPDENLIGRVFLRDRLVVVAHPSIRRGGRSPIPAVMRGDGDQSTWTVITEQGRRTLAIEPVLRLSSMIMIRDAVRAGIGVGRLPFSLVSRDLADGSLERWGDMEGAEIALWTLYPTRRLLSARVAAFLDHLKECFPQGTPEELAAYL